MMLVTILAVYFRYFPPGHAWTILALGCIGVNRLMNGVERDSEMYFSISIAKRSSNFQRLCSECDFVVGDVLLGFKVHD